MPAFTGRATSPAGPARLARQPAKSRVEAAAADLLSCQTALRRSEELLDIIGRAVTVGGWNLDLLTDEIIWTAETYRIHGVPPDYRPTLEAAIAFYAPDARPAIRAAMAGATAAGESWDLELPFVAADGRQLWVRAVGRVTCEGGRPVRISGILQDVTERNRLQMVLQHSQKMNALGSLAAGVAHDFNNILQTIAGGLEMVMDDLSPGTPTHEMADMGMRSARRGSYLTQHLLSLARKQEPQSEQIKLPALLAEIEPLLSRTLGPHITITRQVGPEVPEVLADPCQLETALLNLAINGAHAMPAGGRLVIAACSTVADGARWVSLSVTDTGAGMDAATLARATEPFFSTKGQNGTGLGLSMVRDFVEQLGGRLRIASTQGQGTRVELQLPPAAPAPPLPLPLPDTAVGRPPRRCIMLVDDEPGVLESTGAALQRAGFTVLLETGGDAALARLAAGTAVDAIVADHVMPGLHGADLIAQAQLMRPGLPAILISGYAEQRELKGLPREVALLPKPFARQDLISALQRLCTGRLDAAR